MRKLLVLVLVLAASGLAACKSDPPATPTPSDESIIEVFREPVLTPEAVIPSRDSSLVGVEVFPDRLIFMYDAPGASVPGAGAVVAGVEEGGYLRRVMSVSELSATRFELTTEHAYLVDLFEDVHFRARFEPERGSWVETGRVGSRTDALGGSFNLIDDLPISEHCGVALHCAGRSSPTTRFASSTRACEPPARTTRRMGSRPSSRGSSWPR